MPLSLTSKSRIKAFPFCLWSGRGGLYNYQSYCEPASIYCNIQTKCGCQYGYGRESKDQGKKKTFVYKAHLLSNLKDKICSYERFTTVLGIQTPPDHPPHFFLLKVEKSQKNATKAFMSLRSKVEAKNSSVLAGSFTNVQNHTPKICRSHVAQLISKTLWKVEGKKKVRLRPISSKTNLISEGNNCL